MTMIIIENFLKDDEAITSYEWLLVKSLDARDIELLTLLGEGFTSKEIGKKIFLSHRTVETHIRILKERYHARSIGQLIWTILKKKSL